MPEVIVDDATIKWYEDFNGVPPSILSTAVAACDETEAASLLAAYSNERTGYCQTRMSSNTTVGDEKADMCYAGSSSGYGECSSSTVELGMGSADEMDGIGFMTGLDEVEMQLDPSPAVDTSGCVAKAASTVEDAASLMARGGVLASATSSSPKPFSDYDPRWPLLVHPTSFPNGTGGCPKRMSMEEWIKLLLNRHPMEQFAQNVALHGDMFNIIQRHKVNTQTFVHMRLHPGLMEQVGSVGPSELTEALELLKAGLRGVALHVRLEKASAGAKALYKSFKVSSTRILGSPQSFQALRGKAGALWHGFGAFTGFLTLNPSEAHARAVFTMAGQDYEFDFGKPTASSPSMMHRWKTIAANPGLCAKFFQVFMQAFQAVFLGWPIGSIEQQDLDCLFGRVLAWYWKHETGGRGAPHSHGQFVAVCLQPENLKRLMHELPEQLTRYIEMLMCRFVPDVPGCGLQLYKDEQRPVHAASYEVALPERSAACVQGDAVPVFTVNPEDKQRLLNHIANCVLESQRHKHTHTCSKNGFGGTDADCRMAMPRPEVPETAVFPDSGVFVVKCNDPMVVPYIPSLMLAMPCNHAMYLSAEGSKWWREVWLHDLKKATAGGTDATRPVLPTVYQAAAESAEYACKYCTKSDCVGLNCALLQAADNMLQRAMDSAEASGELVQV